MTAETVNDIIKLNGADTMKKMIFPVITELENRLPYYLSGVGCFYDQEDIRRPSGYPEFQWIQCRRGRGELFIGSSRYIVEEGQGMLLFPNEPHSYHRIGDVWDVDWVIFRGNQIEDFLLNTAMMKGSGVYYVSACRTLSDKIAELYNSALAYSPAGSLRCSALVYEILTDIMRLTSQTQNNSISGKFEWLKPVLAYINDNYQHSLTLQELAEIAGVTPQYLCGAFKRFTSRTVFEYINMTKIRKSKELMLSDKYMQVKEAARIVGFHNDSYFCAMFRRFEKMSPTEFRALHGGK